MDILSTTYWLPLAGMLVALLIGIASALSAGFARAEQLREEAAKLEMDILLGNITREEIANADTSLKIPFVSSRLDAANWKVTGAMFVALAAAALVIAAVFVFVATRAVLPTVLTAIVFAAAPVVTLNMAAKKARARFSEQLMTALPMMCTLIKGGSTIQQATLAASENIVEPAATEFARIAREMSVGVDLSAAVTASAKRTRNEDMDYLARAIAIHAEHGGELSGILDSITESIRARVVLRETLKAKVSQPRMEMLVVTAMPWLLFLYFSVAVPSYVRVFWEEPIGWLLLAVAGVLDLVGYLLMKRLVNLKIE